MPQPHRPTNGISFAATSLFAHIPRSRHTDRVFHMTTRYDGIRGRVPGDEMDGFPFVATDCVEPTPEED